MSEQDTYPAEESSGSMPMVEEVPAWLQLGVVVSDGSASMTWEVPDLDEPVPGLSAKTKAEAANSAMLGFLDRMQGGRKKAQFSLAWLSFNDSVTHQIDPRGVDALRDEGSFDPTSHGVGGTKIWTGLEAAADVVEKWMANPPYEGIPMSAVVVLLTDGEDGDKPRTAASAERVKSLPNTRLAACFFATRGKAAEGADFLRQIVTPPESTNFKQVYDSEALRDFFHASLTNLE